MDVDGTPGEDDMPGRIDFEVTADGDVTPVVRMSLGNLGLLTLNSFSSTTPILRLDGKGNENRDFMWRISGATADFDTLILKCEQTSGGEDFTDLFAFHYLGQFGVGTLTLNSKMTIGITINQAANTNEALALKGSGVAHGMTDIAETDTYGLFRIDSGSSGGVVLQGFTESSTAFQLYGLATTDNTTKDATALAPIITNCRKKAGTGVGAMGANANIFAILHAGDTRFIFDEDGDMFYDGAAPANYDEFDDAVACHDLQRHLYNLKRPASERLGDFIQYNKADLVRMGIVSEGGFVSTKGITSLQLGAISQLYKRNKELEAKLETLEKRLEV